jgi:hypothetical protein
VNKEIAKRKLQYGLLVVDKNIGNTTENVRHATFRF